MPRTTRRNNAFNYSNYARHTVRSGSALKSNEDTQQNTRTTYSLPRGPKMYVPRVEEAETVIELSARSLEENKEFRRMLVLFRKARNQLMENPPVQSNSADAFVMGEHNKLIAETSSKSAVRLDFAPSGASITVKGAYGEGNSYIAAKLEGIYWAIAKGSPQLA